MSRSEKSKTRALSAFEHHIIGRDEACVFCKLNFRPTEHVNSIRIDPEVHYHQGKAYAACKYHYNLLSMFRWGKTNYERAHEMSLLLDDYLKDKSEKMEFYWR